MDEENKEKGKDKGKDKEWVKKNENWWSKSTFFMFISLICNVVVCVMLDVTLQRLGPRGKTFCALLHCVAITSSVTFSMNHHWTICLLTILVQF